MQHIKQLLAATLLVCLVATQAAFAQCTVALAPTINSIVATAPTGTPSLAGFTINLTPQCGAARATANACTNGTNGSVFYYLQVVGHGSPAPAGMSNEYGFGSNFTNAAGVSCSSARGSIVAGGAIDFIGCAANKTSTCYELELARKSSSTGATSATGTYNGSWTTTATATLGVCAAVPLAFTASTSALCAGQRYDAYVWEIIINRPAATAAGAVTTSSVSRVNNTLMNDIVCARVVNTITTAAVSEARSAKVTFTVGGTTNQISDPVLTVAGIAACPTGNGAYSSTFRQQPNAASLDNGAAGSGCTPNTYVLNGTNSLAGASAATNDTLVSATPLVAASNGRNVVVVNCRDNITLGIGSPTTCKGAPSGNNFGVVDCNPAVTSYPAGTTAVYFYNNGIQLTPNSGPTVTACAAALAPCTPTPSGNTYPNDYTGLLGAFAGTTAAGAQCVTNVIGNPFGSAGVNPFTLPGTYTRDFGDGVTRNVSTVCVRYEDACNGSKSTSCIKFISDVPTLAATVTKLDESCPGANNACITISDLKGGFVDQNTSGATAAEVGSYVISSVPALTFAPAGATLRASAVAAGSYTITIKDQTGGPCNRACDIIRTVTVNTAVADTAKLASSAASICGGATANLTATLKECPTVSNGTGTGAGQTGVINGTQACSATTGQGRTYALTPPAGCRPSKLNSITFTIGTFTDVAFKLRDIQILVDGVLIMKGDSYTGGLVTMAGTSGTFTITNGAAPPALGYGNGQQTVTSPLTAGSLQIFDANCNFGANSVLNLTAFSGVYDTYTYANTGTFLAADPTYTVVPACAGCLSVASGATASVFTAPAVTTCTTYRVSLAGKNASARTLCAGGTTNCDATPSFVDVVVSPKPTITATNLVCNATTDVITAMGSGGGAYQYCLTGVTPAGCLPVLPPCNTTGSFTGLPNCVSGATLTIQNSAPVAPCLACPSSSLSFPACVLPVSFLSFDAKYETKKVVLNWLVTSETNIGSYEVQRSADNVSFKTIATVAPQNGGSVTTSYFSVDENAVAGFNYYRIVIRDLDGKTDKTPVVRILVGDSKIDIISAMPNPTQGVLNYSINVPQGTSANITIRDSKGKLVYKTLVVMGKGTNTYTYDAAQLAAGLYMLEATDAKSGARSNIKFVKE